jgi:hypothetical protein
MTINPFDIDESDDLAEKIGDRLVQVLGLKRDKLDKSRFYTFWGSKTKKGIARTVLRILTEEEED